MHNDIVSNPEYVRQELHACVRGSTLLSMLSPNYQGTVGVWLKGRVDRGVISKDDYDVKYEGSNMDWIVKASVVPQLAESAGIRCVPAQQQDLFPAPSVAHKGPFEGLPAPKMLTPEVNKGGRPSLGDKAITPAERQAKRRAEIAEAGAGAGGDEQAVVVADPVLDMRHGRVIADSRDVARAFGKLHAHVLRSIRDLIDKEHSLERSNFGSFKINDLAHPGELITSHYEMDRDGFSLLAMGFNGAKALKWKLKYIKAFNKMEAQLSTQAPAPAPDLRDPDTLTRLLLENLADKKALTAANAVLTAVNAELSATNEELSADSEALRRLANKDGLILLSDLSNNIHINRNKLAAILRKNKWGWVWKDTSEFRATLYATKEGLMDTKDRDIVKPDGTVKTVFQSYFTLKGAVFLSRNEEVLAARYDVSDEAA